MKKFNIKGKYWCENCGKWVETQLISTPDKDGEVIYYEVVCAECSEVLDED